MRKERIKHLILFLILIVIDQASKYWVRTVLAKKDSIILIPDVLRLEYHTNTGAVWGILSGKVGYLSIFTLIILVLITFLYFKIPDGKRHNVLKTIVVFIMAGALGNLMDRVLLGHVVDCIYFELINFPLFNFADSCLTISSILLFILALFYFKDEDFAFIEQIIHRKKASEAAKDDSLSNNSKEEPKADKAEEPEVPAQEKKNVGKSSEEKDE